MTLTKTQTLDVAERLFAAMHSSTCAAVSVTTPLGNTCTTVSLGLAMATAAAALTRA